MRCESPAVCRSGEATGSICASVSCIRWSSASDRRGVTERIPRTNIFPAWGTGCRAGFKYFQFAGDERKIGITFRGLAKGPSCRDRRGEEDRADPGGAVVEVEAGGEQAGDTARGAAAVCYLSWEGEA